MKYGCLLLLLVLACGFSQAQDKILLMNGQSLDCKILSDSTIDLVFQLTKKNGKVKVLERHKNDVFSYTYAGKPEIILYRQDEMLGDLYSTDEMRIFLAGQHDARANYHPHATAIVGFVLCGGVAYWGQDGFLTAIGPATVYTLLQFIPKIRIKEKTMSDPRFKYNDIYADGYEPPARSRKVGQAAAAGYSGAVLGATLWFLLGKK